MKKRFLAMLLTLVMCAAMWPLSALAAGETLTGEYAAGVVTVTGGNFEPGNYIIDVRTQSGDAIALGHAKINDGSFTANITTGALENGTYSLKAYLWDGTLTKENTFELTETASSACDVVTVISPASAAKNEETKTITASVANSVTSVTVNVAVSAGADWKLYSDQACSNEIANKTMSLSVGANTAYIKVTAQNGDAKVYTLTITRASRSSGGGGGSAPTTPAEEDPDKDKEKAPEEKPSAVEEIRLAGYSRIDTAIALSQKGWPEKADTVVVAYAYSFPDALAAAPLAYKENAPILLTDQQRITSTTLTEIQRLSPAKVILVGGTAVLSAEVENTLLETCQVTRYAGYDRYETAAQIADAVGTTGRAVVVNGQVYQDALVVSSYAANQGIPILFTERDTLPAVTTASLNSLGINRTIVTGGSGVVSAEVYAQLPSPTRYAGYDCYETATAVAGAAELNMNLENVYVVTGLDFADALVAGNLAARTLSPLIMVGGGDSLPTATENFFQTNKEKIKGFTVVGGTVVVPESQVDAIRNILK